MKLTAAELATVDASLEQLFPGGFPCVMCHAMGSKESVGFKVFGPVALTGPRSGDEGRAGAIGLTCDRCGHVAIFSAVKLGLGPL